jgi:hypothetical protein
MENGERVSRLRREILFLLQLSLSSSSYHEVHSINEEVRRKIRELKSLLPDTAVRDPDSVITRL